MPHSPAGCLGIGNLPEQRPVVGICNIKGKDVVAPRALGADQDGAPHLIGLRVIVMVIVDVLGRG
ncbi:hypothetical protein ES703_98929 [subsurface metagenome]